MQLTSVEFACFFLLVLSLGWAARPRPTLFQFIILSASYCFYATFSAWFALLLAGVSLLTYGAARALAAFKSRSARKAAMACYAVLVLGNLGFFKYWGLLFDLAGQSLARFGLVSPLPDLSPALPVGISFFTFQGLGYVMDVYRDRGRVCRSLLAVMTFMAFFPTLLSGPILRAGDFLPQLRTTKPAWDDANQAFWLILLGLFKKICLSSYLSEHITRQLFSAPEGFSSLGAGMGVLAYSVQIYCDFSGYSDLAQGLAGLLGLKVPDNFRLPYKARNLRQFWAGWHISLSTWLRDYLYIPLGGNRCSASRRDFNLLATMGLGGLWHGANLTFLVWGLLHGLGLAATHAFSGRSGPGQASGGLAKARSALCWAATFAFVSLAWVFFASPDLATALAILGRVASFRADGLGAGPLVPVIVFAMVASQALSLSRPRTCPAWLRALPAPALGAAVGLIGALIVRLGPDGMPPFMYFSF